jgi:hypothetical protein
MFFGAAVLTVTLVAAFGFGALRFLPVPSILIGFVASVIILLAGYKMAREAPKLPPANPILAALENPQPTTRAIGPQDVLGSWRFYVDAAGCTVVIDLQSEGRYRQLIAGMSGNTIECPGGQWTLDGPKLELADYRSATLGETLRAGWFFGDCEDELIIFVKDDPLAEKMLAARRETPAENFGYAPRDQAAASKQASRPANSRGSSLFADR